MTLRLWMTPSVRWWTALRRRLNYAKVTQWWPLYYYAMLNVCCSQDEDEDEEEEAHHLALYVDTNRPSESSRVTLTLSIGMTSGIWMFSSVNLSLAKSHLLGKWQLAMAR